MLGSLQAGLPGGPELLVLLLLSGVFALPLLLASALIYRDAKQRNSSHVLAWTVGAFLGGVVVWVLYVVVRDEVGSSGPSVRDEL